MSAVIDETDEPSVVLEPIERRIDLRGPVDGVRVALPDGAIGDALEVSRAVVFVAYAGQAAWAVGDTIDVALHRRDVITACRAQVVRHSDGERRGVVLRVTEWPSDQPHPLEGLLD